VPYTSPILTVDKASFEACMLGMALGPTYNKDPVMPNIYDAMPRTASISWKAEKAILFWLGLVVRICLDGCLW
jgi:hypothetical protein